MYKKYDSPLWRKRVIEEVKKDNPKFSKGDLSKIINGAYGVDFSHETLKRLYGIGLVEKPVRNDIERFNLTINYEDYTGLTHKDKILKYIERNGSITALEANTKLHMTSFTARMSDLRKEGYDFKVVAESKKNASWLRYSL